MRVTAVLSIAVFVAPYAGAEEHVLPYFPERTPDREGFVRIINHTDEHGTVAINARDDAGAEHGPVHLDLPPLSVRHLNSTDLENGNAEKGLPEGIQGIPGEPVQLLLDADVTIEPLAFVRTNDGFVTSVHDPVEAANYIQRVLTFNPPRNTNQRSILHLRNESDDPASVNIYPRDDGGWTYTTTTVELDARGAARITAPELSGMADREPVGKLDLEISSNRPVTVLSLVDTPTGHITNVSRRIGAARLPILDDADRQGFVRIGKRTPEPTTVELTGIDEEGNRHGPLTLALETAGRYGARQVNTTDLREGNADKGLTGEPFGDTSIVWLELTTDHPVAAASFLRTADGFMTGVGDQVLREGHSHRVHTFNPASNVNQRSLLRVTNPTGSQVELAITGRDDRGEEAGPVTLSLAAGVTRTLTAPQLENGDPDLVGILGDGNGKWQLTLDADGPLEVLSLMASPTGHLTNISATPAERRHTMPREAHNVFLRTVRVMRDTTPVFTPGYTRASVWGSVRTKESASLKYFEAAIWEAVGAVSLYEFPNDYDVSRHSAVNLYHGARNDRVKIDYREQYRVAQVDLPARTRWNVPKRCGGPSRGSWT